MPHERNPNPIAANDLPHLVSAWQHYRKQKNMPVGNFIGHQLPEHFDSPFIDDMTKLSPAKRERLFALAQALCQKKRLGRAVMEEVLLQVCQGNFVGISALAEIVARDAQSIRQQYLKPLVDEGRLRLAFPQFKNDPRQGYITHPGLLTQHDKDVIDQAVIEKK